MAAARVLSLLVSRFCRPCPLAYCRPSTYAHVCSRMLTYADVWSRMVTYADVMVTKSGASLAAALSLTDAAQGTHSLRAAGVLASSGSASRG